MFGRGIHLFTLFGFEVKLDWSWFIIAILLAWSLAANIFPQFFPDLSTATYWWMGIAGVVGLFISIVLHEFGHSVAARKFGIPMKGITLFVFGGVAEMGGHPPTPKSEFVMAIAGPIVSIVLAGLFVLMTWFSAVSGWADSVQAVFGYLAWINVVVTVFNLVPAFPLDGGRVLRSALWAWKNDLRWSTRIASRFGIGFAFLLMAWGVVSFVFGNFIGGIWAVLIGMFIRAASQMSYQQVLVREVLEGEPVRHFMSPNPITVPDSTSVKEIVDNYVYRYPYKTFPVVHENELVGCISVDQLKQIPREEWAGRTAASLATPCSSKNTVDPDADAAKALFTMSQNQTSRLMVVDHGRLLGIVALKDLMNFLSRRIELEGA